MPSTGSINPVMQLIPFALIFVIFYFLLIKPQRQKEKERQLMLGSLSKNDDVVTTGGIHGTVVNVKEKTVILRVDENVRLEVDKNCIAYKELKSGAASNE